jgi:hypothetical protein
MPINWQKVDKMCSQFQWRDQENFEKVKNADFPFSQIEDLSFNSEDFHLMKSLTKIW